MKVRMAPRGICASMDGKEKDDKEKTTAKTGINQIRAKSSKEEELMQVYN